MRGHINEYLHTSFANSGRAAGTGISYDRYDDESGYRPRPLDRGPIRFPSDGLTPEEKEALNGPVIVYKAEKRSCENCGNLRCANGPIAYHWDECVDTNFTKHWMPKRVEGQA